MPDDADIAAELQQAEISAALRAHALRKRRPIMSWCIDCYTTLDLQRQACGWNLCPDCEADRKAGAA